VEHLSLPISRSAEISGAVIGFWTGAFRSVGIEKLILLSKLRAVLMRAGTRVGELVGQAACRSYR
jgi:hypothetical protein